MDKKDRAKLLKRFEPVLKFTQGELFFPMDAQSYLQYCSLWTHRPELGAEKILAEGEISFKNLADHPAQGLGSVQYLKFTDPLKVGELARYRFNQLRKTLRKQAFRAGPGRLTRVGYVSRFLDALFSLSLLTRGRVTGDQAAASALRYQELREEGAGFRYYGRVVQERDWTVLQYWYFYAYNDWRSGYFGLNDHEADWEQVSIYLYENEAGEWEPAWLAYASHDFAGDDLRRHWDDEDVAKEGEHPVVFVGAGSHASFYQAGEYLTEIVLPPLSPLIKALRRASEALQRLFAGVEEVRDERNYDFLHVPFIDYARGDGQSIGKGQEHKWEEPELISEKVDWVSGYRGLWGLWTQDPLMGENAPAGPMYDRFGGVRRAWYDPLGWAGMNKISPPNKQLARTQQRQQAIRARRRAAEISLAEKNSTLRNLELEAQAMEAQPHLEEQRKRHIIRMRLLEEEIGQERAQIAEDKALMEALEGHAEELEQGQRGNLRRHLRRPQIPDQRIMLRFRRLAEAWSALSIGLAIIAFLGIALFARDHLLLGGLILLGVILVMEATFQGRLRGLANWLTGLLALIASLVLITEFFTPLLVGLLLLIGGYLLYDNLREFWS